MKAIREHRSTIITLLIPTLFIALILFNALANGAINY